jgi:hypothetical protein
LRRSPRRGATFLARSAPTLIAVLCVALPVTLITVKQGTAVDEWTHCLQVVSDLRAHPPADPLVLLLGGSSARECTISDARWADEIRALGGPLVVARNLGSKARTTAQDVEIAKALPRTRAVVYIGVRLSRFTSRVTTAHIDLPQPGRVSTYRQHWYWASQVRSAAERRMLAKRWPQDCGPRFDKNFAKGTRMLRRLVRACSDRGLHPVLLELPYDASYVDKTLDEQMSRMRQACLDLARDQGIPFVSFNDAARLQSSDFYDLWHLVEPGRTKWQRLLSQTTVDLLRRYGLGGGGS